MAEQPAASGQRVKATAMVEVTVDVPAEYGNGSSGVAQAIQDDIGFAGVKVIEVLEWEQTP